MPNPARVTCPGGVGTCTQEMDFVVSEIAGVAVADPFRVQLTNELGQSGIAVVPGVNAGGSFGGTIILGPAGDNCYNPNCTTRARVDIPLPGGLIVESDETNNTASRTDPG